VRSEYSAIVERRLARKLCGLPHEAPRSAQGQSAPRRAFEAAGLIVGRIIGKTRFIRRRRVTKPVSICRGARTGTLQEQLIIVSLRGQRLAAD
jgi:hypothetical protein